MAKAKHSTMFGEATPYMMQKTGVWWKFLLVGQKLETYHQWYNGLNKHSCVRMAQSKFRFKT